MKKKILVLAIVSGLCYSIQAQTGKFGAREGMIQKRNSEIENPLGLYANNYLVLINDFGKTLDFNNNIRANIAKYSVSNLANKGTVYLNPLIADGVADDKIISTHTFQWKGRILCFYSVKRENSPKTFSMYARFFDSNMKPSGKKIDIGEVPYTTNGGGKVGRRNAYIDGSYNLVAIYDFRFRISNDSSRLAIIMPTESEGDAISLKIRTYDKDLNLMKETAARLATAEHAEIKEMSLSNNGYLYVFTKTIRPRSERRESKGDGDYNLELHAINTADGKVIRKDIGLPDQTLLWVTLLIDSKERPTIISLYHDYSKIKEQRGHGIYTAKFDPQSLTVTARHQQEFNAELLAKELSEKEIKREKGISSLKFTEIVRRDDGSFYALGQVVFVGERTVATGTPAGTSNVTDKTYGIIVYCYIDADGKVRWSKGMEGNNKNVDDRTSTTGALMTFQNNKLYVVVQTDNGLKKKESAKGIKFTSHDDSGKTVSEKFVELSEELQKFGIVSRSFYQCAENTIMGCLYYGFVRGHNEMELAIMQIKF